MEWVDPTLGYPDPTLVEGVEKIPKGGHYVAIRGDWTHKTIKDGTAIHTTHLERVDDQSWELFIAQLRKGDLVWGQFVEGLGLMHVMTTVPQVRELTQAERDRLSTVVVGMYGSHSGKLSYSFNLHGIQEQTTEQFATA
jgi:hypothetical protein